MRTKTFLTRCLGQSGSCLAALLLLAGGVPGEGADVLQDFRPSSMTSRHGPVMEVEFRTPSLLRVDSDMLAFHVPGTGRQLRFAEPVWILAYETEIYDETGQEPSENFLCHTFMGNQPVHQTASAEGHALSHEMKVIFSDAFTRAVRLPPGLGLRFSPQDTIDWMPMFNNRGTELARVGMRAKIHLIRESELTEPLRPLHSMLKAVRFPHLFFVPPGRHEQETTFELPFDGRIHFVGAHIHPHAESITLFNLTRHQLVWKGRAKTDSGGRTNGMETFSDAEGYEVRGGEQFRLTSAYNNPTDFPIDAMAGAFIFYSKE